MKNSALAFCFGVILTAAFFVLFKTAGPHQQGDHVETKAAGSYNSCSQFCNDRPDLLPPPEFSKSMPEKVKPDLDNGILVKWEPVPNAVRYRVILLDKNGERFKSASTQRAFMYLPNLPRAEKNQDLEFSVALASIDKNDQEGRMGERKKFTVRAGDPLAGAPKIKEIKVEDE
ncbi:MAG: hypothetical protein ACK5P7_03295 [Bdellovibrio sp.]|jgi:hypothetical protein